MGSRSTYDRRIEQLESAVVARGGLREGLADLLLAERSAA